MSECAALATQTNRASAAIEDLRTNTERSTVALTYGCSEDRVARKEAAEAKYIIRQCETQQFAIASAATDSVQSAIQVHALRYQLNTLSRDVVTSRSHRAEVAREVRELARQVAGSALQAPAQRQVEYQTAEWATSAQQRALGQRLDETVTSDVIHACF